MNAGRSAKKRLTATGLRSPERRATPYYISDELQVGLRLRVPPAGRPTWNVAFRIKGDSATKSASLGPCDVDGKTGLNLQEARARAAEIIKAARQGRNLMAEEDVARREVKARLSIADLIDRYSRHIKSPHRRGGTLRTADDIERRLKRAFKSRLTDAADDIQRRDISAMLDPIFERWPREAEKRRQVIGTMYRWAVSKGYVVADPTDGTETYGSGQPRERVLSRAEIATVWQWLESGADSMPPDCVRVLQIQLCIGARVGEVAGMAANEISREGDKLVWTLPPSRSKNKNERRTPLIGRARAIVEDVLERRKSGALFRTLAGDRALQSTDIGHALKNRDLPCPHFTSHDLRRTVVSMMDEAGIGLDTIAAVVGHQRGSRATRTLVRHYSRPKLDERVQAALAAWDARLTDIIEGEPGRDSPNVIQMIR